MLVTSPSTARSAATSRSASAPATPASTAANQFSANRAFIQLAGFTFGLSQSFYDFYSVPATAYWGSYPASDTGDPGWMCQAYTAQFGNGLSATISAEQRRMTQIISSEPAGLLDRWWAVPRWCLVAPHVAVTGGWAARAAVSHRCGSLRRLPGAGYRRQPARRPGLGFCPDHGRSASGQWLPTTAESATSGTVAGLRPSVRASGASLSAPASS